MSVRRLIKLIDRQAKIQEDLQDDCSLEENSLPSDARAQRRELDLKADLHHSFASKLQDISADGETVEEVVRMLRELSAELQGRADTPSPNRAANMVENQLLAGFRSTIASIIAQGTEPDPTVGQALPSHLVAELETLSESHSIEVLNILRTRHGWAGSLVTAAEIRDELEMLLPEVAESHIAAVKATDHWQNNISGSALEVTQTGLARAVDMSLR
jgi:hypothetical protein